MRRKRGSDVAKDGEAVRVPMFFKDEDGLPGRRVFLDDDGEIEVADWQADVIRDAKVAHALGLEDGLDLHKPGFRLCDAAGHEAKAKAYLQAVQDAENAWRQPARDAGRDDPIAGFSKLTEFHGGRVGDPCTCRGPEYPLDFGSPGHLERRDGQLVCVPDNPREDSRDERSRAYDEMCRLMQDAWRGRK